MDEFIKRSPITGRKYNYFSKDIIRIVNFHQAFYYIENGIIPLDIVLSKDRNNSDKNIILFLFSKEESQYIYNQWINHRKELENDT